MAIRKIVQSKESGGTDREEELLHCKAVPVDVINEEILSIIQDLRDTLWAYPFCTGLSAPQIGSKYAISVINLNRETVNDDMVLINPIIISLSGKKDRKRESCMSVWGKMGEVERRSKISLEYRDIDFQVRQASFSGFESRVIQHELDHLEGILYSDRLCGDSTLQKADFFERYEIIDN